MIFDYQQHSKIIENLGKAQDFEDEQREDVIESHSFVDDKDGQWEQNIINALSNRPRYTFDKVTPIIDQIAGSFSKAEFALKVAPSGGRSSEKTAKIMTGIIRAIRANSGSGHIYKDCARNVITGGMDGWEITHDYDSPESFDQDLFIRKIHNFWSRVWFDPDALERDKRDAEWVIVLHDITPEQAKHDFNMENISGLDDGRDFDRQCNHEELVQIGRILYKKKEKKTLIKMSNGNVYVENEEYLSVVEELNAMGVVEEERRQTEIETVYQRYFDANEFLKEEEETVFGPYLPIVPAYGNYKVSKGRVLYKGVVRNLMDAQRVYNYTRSRAAEEVALGPKSKYWATPKQLAAHVDEISTLNTNNDPVQLFTPDDEFPGPPIWQQGSTINAGAEQVSATSEKDINNSAGMFNSSMGDNPNLQSGIAIDRQIERGDNGSSKWFEAMEIAIAHTGKILVKAIPIVYKNKRQAKIVGENGTPSMERINTSILDEETKNVIELHNLNTGLYDVVCEVGDAFKTQQRETADSLVKVAQIDPSIMETGKDVFLRNLSVPGMSDVTERVRAQMLMQGVIPQSQWTDEESAFMEQIQQQNKENSQPTPEETIAQAEMVKAQAEMTNATNKQIELQIKAQSIALDAQGKQDKLSSEIDLNQARTMQAQQQIELKGRELEMNTIMQAQKIQLEEQKLEMQKNQSIMKSMMEAQKAVVDNLNKQADTLNKIKGAMGVDVVISPEGAEAYKKQAQIVGSEQNK